MHIDSLAARAAATARFLADDPVRKARTGTTSHEVIHRHNKACVRYFAPRTGEATAAPIFVSMPLINHWYIWDLLPQVSLVARLAEAGVPVYLLDWGAPGPEDSHTTLAYLIDRVLHRSIDRARRHAKAHHGAETLDAVGYCVGGTFLAIYLGQYPEAARRACFVATPIDFHASGRLSVWASPGSFPMDQAIDGFGNYPGAIIQDAFAWLKPSGQTSKWVGLWERIDREGFPELWAALEKWSGDAMDFPGEAYREYVRRCYFENALMDDEDRWIMANRAVHLRDVKVPAHAIAANRDHIVPPPAAFGLEKAWGGPVTTQTIKGGHVGICVSGALADALLEWTRA
ncbi:MAG: alpha/beta fold hydrolase [Alphaproteobacteria bacterium]|nr:alpha/beta fold hydrolase [Alphaproteobacteria bacterium]